VISLGRRHGEREPAVLHASFAAPRRASARSACTSTVRSGSRVPVLAPRLLALVIGAPPGALEAEHDLGDAAHGRTAVEPGLGRGVAMMCALRQPRHQRESTAQKGRSPWWNRLPFAVRLRAS
jgi:hypothetical protein